MEIINCMTLFPRLDHSLSDALKRLMKKCNPAKPKVLTMPCPCTVVSIERKYGSKEVTSTNLSQTC